MECSNVLFDEEENAHTEEQMEAIEFRENADELQDEIQEANMNEISDLMSQESSKSRNLISPSVNWQKPASLGRSLLVWVEACQIQYLGRCLPVWAEAYWFGQKPTKFNIWAEACQFGQMPADFVQKPVE